MKRLGFRASWRTECFIDGGCGELTWAHTNGDGDFVLLDKLQPPWPIHRCYARRVPLAMSSAHDISASHNIDWDPDIDPPVALVERVAAEDLDKSSVSIVGAILHIQKGILGVLRRSRHASATTDREIRDRLKGYNAYARFVTGDQKEYWAFLNTKEHRVKETDIVAARLKVTTILGAKEFKVTDLVIFTADDRRD